MRVEVLDTRPTAAIWIPGSAARPRNDVEEEGRRFVLQRSCSFESEAWIPDILRSRSLSSGLPEARSGGSLTRTGMTVGLCFSANCRGCGSASSLRIKTGEDRAAAPTIASRRGRRRRDTDPLHFWHGGFLSLWMVSPALASCVRARVDGRRLPVSRLIQD